MNLLNKHFWKFLAGMLGVLALGFLAVYGAGIYDNSGALRDWWNARKAQNEYEALKKLYEEDTYGGKTPEETLALFIDALKKGDTDLAAKYVWIDDQEKVRVDLLQAKTTGNLNKAIERFGLIKKSKTEIDEASFTVLGEDSIVKYQILLGKNQNDVWKILEL